ncbi:protein mono-ADP-ribosyltransferase PARP12-like [Coccinella septempunctata]|uniref:protein mono-ADP-ribosyltransferase PARP12-like n=1 Tax=Coccinella septempunctata TaxID=41139 RepID=UPI001D093D49|nr:protein mono-ADP-ribosyltransferase PARP12-like [Coccinella septempunctata]
MYHHKHRPLFDWNYFPPYEDIENGEPGPLYYSERLNEISEEYMRVKNRMNMKDIEIISISSIENKFLRRSYELKKQQKKRENQFIFEFDLFHGTKYESAKNIFIENFDWRRAGSRSKRCYYGKGVYFTHDATISRKYPKKSIGLRYMILSKVLVGYFASGERWMTIPPPGTDTTVSRDKMEFVKFEDNEFCPTHEIVFIIKDVGDEESSFAIDGIEPQGSIVIGNSSNDSSDDEEDSYSDSSSDESEEDCEDQQNENFSLRNLFGFIKMIVQHTMKLLSLSITGKGDYDDSESDSSEDCSVYEDVLSND